jgi:hypothetical protein
MRSFAHWPFRPRFSLVELILIFAAVNQFVAGQYMASIASGFAAAAAAWIWNMLETGEAERR